MYATAVSQPVATDMIPPVEKSKVIAFFSGCETMDSEELEALTAYVEATFPAPLSRE